MTGERSKPKNPEIKVLYWENYLLRIGGYINIIIAIAHLVGLVWADQMYTFTGIARQMEDLSRIHSAYPFLLTLFMAIIFFVCGLYGLSAGEEIWHLPALYHITHAISAVYLIRGVGGLALEMLQDFPSSKQYVFSGIALAIGLLYLVGASIKWNRKTPIEPGRNK